LSRRNVRPGQNVCPGQNVRSGQNVRPGRNVRSGRSRRVRKNRLKSLLSWALALAVTLGIALAVRTWGVQPVRIAGTSMEGTLMSGDLALVTKFDYLNDAPERGDVVLCRLPGREAEYVKRVIGLPGETIEIAGGQVLSNGAALHEPSAVAAGEDYPARTLSADDYFVLGDNRAVSYDSREEDIGSLASGDFLGRVRCILWPLDRLFAGID